MKRIIIIASLVLLIVGCSNKKTFTVQGVIDGASDKTLIFESSNLQGLLVLDSVKLNSKGNYKFTVEAPLSPEFYRLKIDNKVINLSIDSTEVVTINSKYDTFGRDYEVIGSENVLKIKEIVNKQIVLQQESDKLVKQAYNGVINNRTLQDKLTQLYNDYKEDMKRNYILSAPNTTAAYYALYPKINGFMLFDPLNNKDDLRSFAAVATSFHDKYPHSDRAKNMYNIVIKGMKNTRQPKTTELSIPEDKVKVTGIIDIELRDMNGRMQKLSDLKGKVVLLDFNIFQSPVSSTHIFALRDLYEKYAAKGLEIFQVSLDADEHFWKLAVDNLPWICVRDEKGVYSNYAALYNLTKYPSYFIINRDNELSARGDQIADIEKTIKQLL